MVIYFLIEVNRFILHFIGLTKEQIATNTNINKVKNAMEICLFILSYHRSKSQSTVYSYLMNISQVLEKCRI